MPHENGEPAAPLARHTERAAAGIDCFVDAVGRASAWLTLVLVLLMAVDVLLRYAFSVGAVWAQELQWHLLAPLVLAGMTYALQKGDHVRVDVLYGRWSPRTQALVDLLAAILAVGFSVLVIRYSIRFVAQSYGVDEISPDPGGLTHRWVLKALIPIGFALFGVQAIGQALRAAARLRGSAAP